MPGVFYFSKYFPGLELPHAKNFEVNRLQTYKGWNNLGVYTSRLAKAGFYYTEIEDLVQCAFCDLQCRGHEALPSHETRSPSCHIFTNELIVNQRTGPNIKLPEVQQGRAEFAPLVQTYLRRFGVSASGIHVSPENPLSDEDKSVNPPVSTLGVLLRGPRPRLGNRSPWLQQLMLTVPTAVDGSTAYTAQHKNSNTKEAQHPQFMPESCRRQTFHHFMFGNRDDTTQTSLVVQLINQGFFFTGHNDIVICYFCGLGLHQWLAGDDPKIAHARWSPDCRHLHYVVSAAFVDAIRRELYVIPGQQ